jgi:glycosyltransferase involved in cell wall biosynthesis
MLILVIAYEFPPSPSPQSLRWAYLARELHRLGHEVEVLTIDLGAPEAGLPALPPGIVFLRTFAVTIRGLVAWRRRRGARCRGAGRDAAHAEVPSRSGWKHWVSMVLQRVGESLWFPDLRGEWRSYAQPRLDALLSQRTPDVVISSHEPATTLELGLRAKQAGFRWVADLADPVLAPYTLARWRARARRLEAKVCAQADALLVTTPAAGALLAERHALVAPLHVLTQGFDDALPPAPASLATAPGAPLELLYTGSFYSFRSARELLQAVLDTPGLRLNIATIHAPDEVVAASRRHPDRIRMLGFLPHLDALAWQRRADVLVNLANRDPGQVPGKCYEYMGAGRPILHLGTDPSDAVAAQVLALRRGWVCAPDAAAISDRLRQLARLHADGRVAEGLQLDRAGVAGFGWSHLAGRLDGVLRTLPR